MSRFYEIEPSLENYWRAVILFGNNVASYKFALGKSLLELGAVQDDLVRLEQLAEPFSRHLCEHLQHAPKQITSKSSKFLDTCNSFNRGELSQQALIEQTVKRGFNNVIDAFHIVNRAEIDKRFFIDERKTHGGIRITDAFFQLTESDQFQSFEHETEARWRLVEEAWGMGVSRNLVSVEYDRDLKALFTSNRERRVNITSCRDSLNGYQKGHCFYCYTPISVEPHSPRLADVDHFLPWMLNQDIPSINGVWNLVLACPECNRGEEGKFARIPSLPLLERLHRRNEYLINSHLPLRETLISQTGRSTAQRAQFLQTQYNIAKQRLIHQWQPQARGEAKF
ncbi:HNH endonuclease domain-containing protein [Ferrimonas balearica]|uniref:HNH endonuclease domain-containing protein n=1 Tax=Ferrimonas balearica TaxID=44012 RepID=UPI001C996A01|nr:HNH endonuclease domain-containing protein [Ferrimonas balearica]MBY5923385.1 HNH endonuclease [Ferrimonas balearica]MBY5995135.1 HNH endonuclease [Ferrimonas balearica]